jgi:hypothetical protein
MDLSKQEIVRLRREKAISREQAIELMSEIEAEPEEDQTLQDLLAAVKAIKIPETPLAGLEIRLIEIKTAIEKLVSLANLGSSANLDKPVREKTEKKTWEFVPVYDGTGKITKVVVR